MCLIIDWQIKKSWYIDRWLGEEEMTELTKKQRGLLFSKGLHFPDTTEGNEVAVLQVKLIELPLIPRSPPMRKKVDKTRALLMKKAREAQLVSNINLQVGTIDWVHH